MSSPDELNKLLNRALRVVNHVNVSAASVLLSKRKEALTEGAKALEHLLTLQRLFYAEHPDAEYHNDPQRPRTPYMNAVAGLIDQAEDAIRAGRKHDAILFLRRAIEMEPPPLTYEALSKKLQSLGATAP